MVEELDAGLAIDLKAALDVSERIISEIEESN